MWKSLISVLSAMMISFFPVFAGDMGPEPPAGAAVVRCLAAGMDLFVTEENTAPCSANNAEAMAALMAAYLPPGTKITRSVNGPGSAAGMMQLLREAFDGAGEEDTSILYLSTHGVTWEEEDGTLRAALILSDGTREEAISPEVLRTMLESIPGKKVLILDCCHAGAVAAAFDGPEFRVLAGCGAEEDCYFHSADKATGSGYFTAALENALRASDAGQIDPDGDGWVSLGELAARTREIYGVGAAEFLPEGDGEPLFFLPAERGAVERLLGIGFEPTYEEDGQLVLPFAFRTDTAVKLEYRLTPAGTDGWDFAETVRMPDKERTDQTRGLLSPGEKTRTIRVGRERFGEGGKVLLQVISLRGIHRQIPVVEATVVIGE